MIITVASCRGEVGNTTTAVHLAAYLQRFAPALLVDGDHNRSATGWTRRGALPFKVIDVRQTARYARDFEHIVIDTVVEPTPDDLRHVAGGCDLLVLPTTPDVRALETLMLSVAALQSAGADNYRILLTMVPIRPCRAADEARAMLEARNLPLFKGEVHRLVAFRKAAFMGVPVYAVQTTRAATAWQDYEQVGREIMT